MKIRESKSKQGRSWATAGAALPTVLALAVLVFLSGSAGAQTTEPAPPRSIQELALDWLLLNCGLGNTLVTESDLVASAAGLEPIFLEALREGPAPKWVEEVRQDARQRFEARNRLLEDRADALGLEPEDLERAAATTAEQYVARQVADFELRYRAQAVAGLGLVGGAEAREVLRSLADDPDSELQVAAQEALRRLTPG